MLILVMANMVILPVAISFFNDDLSTQWIVFNSVCDTVFLTDLLVNFRTGSIASKAKFYSLNFLSRRLTNDGATLIREYINSDENFRDSTTVATMRSFAQWSISHLKDFE